MQSKELTNLCLSSVAPVISILKFFKSNAIIVKKGSAIDIPADVKGLPLPTLQWMKDDVVIEKPEEEKMTMETEEVKTLLCVLTSSSCHKTKLSKMLHVDSSRNLNSFGWTGISVGLI